MSAAQDQHAFIEKVLSKTGWTQTDLANRAGIDPSTLSRFLTKGRDGHALRAHTIQRIANASGLVPGKVQLPPTAGFSEDEAMPYIFATEDARTLAIRTLCSERPNIDAWTLKSNALDGLGYRSGDVLLVSLNETPHAGDIVCAQIYDWTKSKAETVFRLFQPPVLLAATSDTALLKPHLITDNNVVVKGVVLHMLRARQNH